MYQVLDGKIVVSKEDFDSRHILLCGQIFSYEEKQDCFVVYSKDKKADIFDKATCYEIITNDPKYFENFFQYLI